LDELKAQLVEKSLNVMDDKYIKFAGGIPGTHAELRALNELLHKLQANGKIIDDNLLKDIKGFQLKFDENGSLLMPRCGDCHYIEHGVEVILNNL